MSEYGTVYRYEDDYLTEIVMVVSVPALYPATNRECVHLTQCPDDPVCQGHTYPVLMKRWWKRLDRPTSPHRGV